MNIGDMVETPNGIGKVIDILSNGGVHVEFSLTDHDWFDIDEIVAVEDDCEVCNGTGQDDPPPGSYHGICPKCNGTGKNEE